jgi:muramidase (phage lysozyme)
MSDAAAGAGNLLAFLMTIRKCEGTGDSDEGYQALFGYVPGNGRIFTDFSTHPNIRTPFRQTDGTTNYSTAAGAFQEIYGTWVHLNQKLGTSDFTIATQILHASELIAEDSAMEAVLAGRLQDAIDLCSGTWASLPASHYPQPRRSFQFASAAFSTAGGILA